MSSKEVTRRWFIMSTAAAAAGGVATAQSTPKTPSANDKLNIAAVGAGGKGEGDIRGVAPGNNIVALCDVDEARAAESFKRFPKATRYKDFREMFDKEHKNIDAVTVSTPDHMHAVVAMAAMQLGKGVFVQKPLTHDIYAVSYTHLTLPTKRIV